MQLDWKETFSEQKKYGAKRKQTRKCILFCFKRFFFMLLVLFDVKAKNLVDNWCLDWDKSNLK